MNRDGSQNLTVTIHSDFRDAFDELSDKEVNIEIKKASRHRSQEANNYLWALCGQIAQKSSKYSTDGKNEIYREAIRAKGESDALLVKKDALERFLARWSQKGTGWFADVRDDYDDEHVVVDAYYGSSIYDTASMSRIIDYVILIANDLGIPTLTPKEEERMLAAWGRKKGTA